MIKLKRVTYDYETDYNEDVLCFEYIIDEFLNDEAKRIFVSTHLNSYCTNGGVGIKITETFSSKQWSELKEKIKTLIEAHSTSIREQIKEINDFVNFLDSLTEEA